MEVSSMQDFSKAIISIPPRNVDEEETETTYLRVSSTIYHPSDPSTEDQMRIVEASGTLDFWSDPAEDLYAL